MTAINKINRIGKEPFDNKKKSLAALSTGYEFQPQ
jgi:hypothetical protein